jgi:hypothetical protein
MGRNLYRSIIAVREDHASRATAATFDGHSNGVKLRLAGSTPTSRGEKIKIAASRRLFVLGCAVIERVGR